MGRFENENQIREVPSTSAADVPSVSPATSNLDGKTQAKMAAREICSETASVMKQAKDFVADAAVNAKDAVVESYHDLRDNGANDLRKDRAYLHAKKEELPPLGSGGHRDRELHADSTTAPPTADATAGQQAYEAGRMMREESGSALRQARHAVAGAATAVVDATKAAVADLRANGKADFQKDVAYLKRQKEEWPAWSDASQPSVAPAAPVAADSIPPPQPPAQL
jgi:ElaB/YqjD/DUF883 family membrane-anchored ribosome-binding protein